MVRRATSPDGREWEISIRRIRWPKWHDSDYDPFDHATDVVSGIFALIIAPFFWIVLPLGRALVAFPALLARSLFSSKRWVDAVCRWPSEIRITWETSSQRAEEVANHVEKRLLGGYEDLTPQGARLVEMTEPPALGD